MFFQIMSVTNVAVVQYNVIINMIIIEEEDYDFWVWYFGTMGQEIIHQANLVKYDDGNHHQVWIGWHRRMDGTWYNPNWVPPEPEPEEQE